MFWLLFLGMDVPVGGTLALNAWSHCIETSAELIARKSDERADIIGTAAMGMCLKEDAEFYTETAEKISSAEMTRGIWEAQRLRLHDFAVSKALIVQTIRKTGGK